MLSKTYTLKITNNTQGEKSVKIPLDAEAKAIRIVSQAGDAYQIIDDKTGLAPHKVLIKRIDNDLYIRIEEEGDANTPDIILDNYYDDSQHVLVGEYESGQFADYVADGQENSLTTIQIAEENQEGWFHLAHESNDGGALLGILGGIGLIAAFAGGGDGDGNHAPTITSDGGGDNAAVSVDENKSVVTDVNATDSDNDTLSYSIVGGTDAGKFIIDASTGVLSFITAPNYDDPTDSDQNGVYNVNVQVSDGNGGIDIQSIAVTVTDANFAPVITSDGGGATATVNVAENTTAVTDVNATDADQPPDTLIYSIIGGADSNRFVIDASTGELSFNSAPNYELPFGTDNSYEVIVQVYDGKGGTDTQTLTVNVTDVNDAPIITSNGSGATAVVSIVEDTTVVTDVNATDADMPTDTLTYSIAGGIDAAKFTINASTGELSFINAPNYEAPTDDGLNNVYDVIVQVSDGQGGIDTQSIAVTVTDGNFAPVITSNGAGPTAIIDINENQTAVTDVNATDADTPADTLIYSIIGGADATKFTIDPTTGVLNIVNPANYESPADVGLDNVYDVIVQVADGHGGMDTQTLAVHVNDLNEAPVIISNGAGPTAIVNMAENLTAVTDVNATDGDGDTLTYSLTGGADMAKFTINPSTGQLNFIAAPDYDNPTDVGGNNTYDVTVQVSDGVLTDTQAIAVVIGGINEAPVITSNGGGDTATINVAENTTAVTMVTATDSDLLPTPDTLTYSIIGGADSNRFVIDSSTGELNFNSAPNYEAPFGADNSYEVIVQVYDGQGGVDTQTITVNVTDVNDAPIITSNGAGASAVVNIVEDTTAVTDVNATDADMLPTQDTLTYSIAGGIDAAKFTINASTGELSFISAPNYEVPTDDGLNNVYDVIVQVSDGQGGIDTQSIAVTVTDGNFAPVITSNGAGPTATIEINENQTAVTDVNATDADTPADTLIYSIIGGADATKFTIDPTTGVLNIVNPPNYESPADADLNNSYDLLVQVSDGQGGIDTQHLTINVNDVNDVPIIISNGGGTNAAVDVAENTTAITTVMATDGDVPTDTLTYSITGGVDAAKFTIDGSTGALSFIAAPDYESPTDIGSNNVYDVIVQVSDGQGGIDSQAIAVTVTDANDAPIITSNGANLTAAVSIAENTTTVTDVNATDADMLPTPDTLTYSIIGGADEGKFTINANTGELSFISAPNYEVPTDVGTDNIYDVIVRVSDGQGGIDTQSIAVTVTDTNDVPIITSNGGGVSAAVSIVEDTMAVTTVTATDADMLPTQDTLTYSIAGGIDAAKFAINSSTGALSFVTAPNYEAPTDDGLNNVYDVIVQVSDGQGGIDTQAIAVTVTDGNFAPVITSNGAGPTAIIDINENQTAVTDVNATDADTPADTLIYSIIGGADATKFTIDPTTGVLNIVNPPNFESPADVGLNNVYDVTVQVADGHGGIDTQTLAVHVNDLNEAPVIISNGAGPTAIVNMAENLTAVTDVNATDGDGDTLTYSLTGGADMAKFTINPSTGELNFIAAPDYDNPTDVGGNNTYDVTVQVSDGLLTDTQAIAVAIGGVNEAPVITSDGGGATATINVAENTTAVTDVNATDSDLLPTPDTLTYSIIGGADSNRFVIDASTGALSFNSAPNYEAPFGADNSYEVIVQVYDGQGGTDTQTLTVNVTDANDAPIITSNGGGAAATINVAENTTAVTMVMSTDADMLPTQDTLTYSIAGGVDAAKFAINSSTGALSFVTAPNYEAPTDVGGNNVYDVTVQVSDGQGGIDTQSIAVTVTDVDENQAPFISVSSADPMTPGPASLALNIPELQTLATDLTAYDPDADTLTFNIIGGADAALFNINPATGELRFNVAPVFDDPEDAGLNNVYDVIVQVSDGTLTDTQTLAFTITDVLDLTGLNFHKNSMNFKYDPEESVSIVSNTANGVTYEIKTGDTWVNDMVSTHFLRVTGTTDGITDANDFVQFADGSVLRTAGFNNPGGTTLTDGLGHDQLVGGTGNDILIASAGNDLLLGSALHDLTSGNDTMTGGGGYDVFSFHLANEGHDVITDFQDGKDYILVPLSYGSPTETSGDYDSDGMVDDTRLTFAGGTVIDLYNINPAQIGIEDFVNYRLIGSYYGDTMVGTTTGSDLLSGYAGNDNISALAGDDYLWGRTGNDTLTGGAGSDKFCYDWNDSEGSDLIVDFSNGSDKILVYNAASSTVVESVAGGSTLLTFTDGSYATVTPSGGNTVITFNENPSTQITLQGVLASDIHADDFTFIV